MLDEPSQGPTGQWDFVAIDGEDETKPGRVRVAVKQVSEFKKKEWQEFILLHDFCLTGLVFLIFITL